ncbi:MAG: hypothetical protein ACI4V3_03150, partial [Faecousia sp.]
LEWGSRGRWFESSHSDQKSLFSFGKRDFLFSLAQYILISCVSIRALIVSSGRSYRAAAFGELLGGFQIMM